MISMLTDDTIRPLARSTERAAAIAIANAGRRAGASDADIRTALATLFDEVQS